MFDNSEVTMAIKCIRTWVQLLAISVSLLQSSHISATSTCSSGCECIMGAVTCYDLTSFPPYFPEETRSLTFINMDVEYIPQGLFDQLSDLESLQMNGCRIATIGTGAFDSFEYLDEISFFDVRIQEINPFAFRNLTDIGKLAFYNSFIGEIKPYGFSDLFAFDQFQVQNTTVSHMSPMSLHNVDDVYRLNIENSELINVDELAFTNVSNVLDVTIRNNSFQSAWTCGFFENVLQDAYKFSIQQNIATCSCTLYWTIGHSNLHLEAHVSNWCVMPNDGPRILWSDLDLSDLGCDATIDDVMNCEELTTAQHGRELTEFITKTKAATQSLVLNNANVSNQNETPPIPTQETNLSSNSDSDIITSHRNLNKDDNNIENDLSNNPRSEVVRKTGVPARTSVLYRNTNTSPVIILDGLSPRLNRTKPSSSDNKPRNSTSRHLNNTYNNPPSNEIIQRHNKSSILTNNNTRSNRTLINYLTTKSMLVKSLGDDQHYDKSNQTLKDKQTDGKTSAREHVINEYDTSSNTSRLELELEIERTHDANIVSFVHRKQISSEDTKDKLLKTQSES